jgi:hypothetical protein
VAICMMYLIWSRRKPANQLILAYRIGTIQYLYRFVVVVLCSKKTVQDYLHVRIQGAERPACTKDSAIYTAADNNYWPRSNVCRVHACSRAATNQPTVKFNPFHCILWPGPETTWNKQIQTGYDKICGRPGGIASRNDEWT